MNSFLGRLILAFASVSLCITSLRVRAESQEQQTTGSGEPGTQVLSTPSSNFELKIVNGSFLVRQRGSQEWKRASELTEPVVIGLFDGDHKIYVATKAIKPPKAIHARQPDYPSAERKSGGQGQVLMHIVVDEQGAVRLPTVDVSPGPEFAVASIKAVGRWSFEPATLDGQPVAAVIIVTMEFKIH